MSYANNKGTDQPAHPRSLISAFVVCCLDSIIPLVPISELSSLYLASVAEKAGLSQPWSQTPKTDFTAAGVVPCGGRKTSPRTSTIVQFIFYFGPLRSAIIF